MKNLVGSLLFGVAVAFLLLSPILVGLVVLIVVGVLAAAAMDLFAGSGGGSGSSRHIGGREYWRPRR